MHELENVRQHILNALDGVDDAGLRRPVLPSGWTCLGLVNHLSVDVEHFWFQAVIAGEQAAIADVLGSTRNAWDVDASEPAEEVVARYRQNIECAEAIVSTHDLDAAPGWWPENLFSSWRLDAVREIVLHVIVETATHAGHLDAARELIDGKLHLVLTE